MYAWLVTGLFTPTLLAKWRFDGDLKQFEANMKKTICEFKGFLRQQFLQGNKQTPTS